MPRNSKAHVAYTFENQIDKMLTQNSKLAIDAMLAALRREGILRLAVTVSSSNTRYTQESGYVDHLHHQMSSELGQLIQSEAVKTQRDDPNLKGYTLHEMTIEVVRNRT